MLRLFSQRTTYLIIAFFLTFTTSISRADDTEIYFSSGSSSGNSSNAILPNVLLILDTSGSMTATVSGTGKSRMELMKEAMTDIINGVEDVNMGLMRFTYKNGGAIVYPIAGIDDPAADTVSEPDDTKRTLTYSVNSSSDDAEQDTATPFAVLLTDAILNINTLPGGAGGSTVTSRVNTSDDDADQFGSAVGTTAQFYNDGALETARFTGLNIPTGATITAATLTLTERSGISTGSSTVISGEKLSNCVNYSSPGTNELSNRKTAAPTAASTSHTFNNAATPQVINVLTTIQELYGVGAGSNGNPLCLFSQSAGGGSFESFDTSPANAPLLSVTFTTPAPAVTQVTGLRFNNVAIPQGATITDAKVILTPTSSDATTTDIINIKAENATDSTTFTTAASNISGRTTFTKTTNWTLPATTAAAAIASCVDGTCAGDSLASVIQQVTDPSGWCGGNSLNLIIETNTGSKDFYSYDGNSGLSANLEVTYDTTGTLGCVVATETAQIASGSDDAENSSTGSSDLDFDDGIDIGVRFQDIDVPQGATILEASLTFTADANDTGTTNVTIYGEDEDNAGAYGNVSTRNKTDGTGVTGSGSVAWSPPNFSTNSTYKTSELKNLVQEIVNRSGWSTGNAMAFIIETTGNDREAYTYNGSTTKAPRISIKYQASAGFSPVKTVRQKLVELVDDFPTSDWTPITEVLYEAAHYWRGDSVVYGKSRDGLSKTRLSHPGSYCDGDNDCNGASTGTYPPYGVNSPSGCTDANLDASACSTRAISGTPDYISPFSSELSCASNYQVLLTDGQANSANMTSTVPAEFSDISTCRTVDSNNDSLSTSERCSIDLAEMLFEKDQSSTLDNDQTVVTYTVGFNISNQYLKDIAAEGGGEFFEATTASDLVTVFDTILTDVKNNPTSIVSPSLATNAFNRLFSREDVYFGLFTPELNSAWLGNVKKYFVCTEVGTPATCDFITRILDANDVHAVDTANRFNTTAQSVWSDVVDGLETVKGGVGGEMNDFTTRLLYTDATASTVAPAANTSLDDTKYKITSGSWDHTDLSTVRTTVCPTPSTTAASDCEDRMLWMLGKVISIEDSDVDTDTRWTVNDVLHSSPVTITYGGADTDSPADGIVDTFYDKLIVGTNEGGLRMINAETGLEDWMFIPQPLLDLQQSLYSNPEGDHKYGVDLSPIVKQFDVDSDGIIEPADGDKVYAYFGMRRGGLYYYALDLTGASTATSSGIQIIPKFLWRIQGNIPDIVGPPVVEDNFKYLADTWSTPEYTQILTTTGSQDVLIFGGGYDTALDGGFGTTPTGGSDNKGNMIFVVNPATGALIFSIGGSSTNATLKVPEMKYSFAAAPELLDTTGDGNDNRIYIADTGGQIWRVDLASDIAISGSAGSTIIGRLANISTQGTAADERRFFETPEIAAVLDTEFTQASAQKYFLVTLGSGDRSHPLTQTVNDRFYGLRDFAIGNLTPSASPNAHLAKDYPKTSSVPINHAGSDLIDISTAVLDADSTTVDASLGWYMDFASTGHDGEKLLSSPLIVSGNVFFTTYEPDAGNNLDACAANLGGGRLLGFNVLSTRGFLTDDVAGREISTELRGISSAVIPFYAKDGIYGLVGVEGGVLQDVDTDNDGDPDGLKLGDKPYGRTYWSEQTN